MATILAMWNGAPTDGLPELLGRGYRGRLSEAWAIWSPWEDEVGPTPEPA